MANNSTWLKSHFLSLEYGPDEEIDQEFSDFPISSISS